MKILFIINKKLGFFERRNIINSSRFNKIFIFDLCFDLNKKFYTQNQIIKNVIKENLFNSKNFFLIQSVYKKKLKNFLKSNPTFIEFKFSEFNLSDYWWKLIFKQEIINIFCKKNKISEIKIYDKFISDLSSVLSSQGDNKYNLRKKNILNLLLYNIYFKKIALGNFIKEISAYFVANKIINIRHNKNSNFIFSSFPYGWIFSKKIYNRFFGNKISLKNCHLFSITRNNQYKLDFKISSLKYLKKVKYYVVLETYGSLKYIFLSYFLKKNLKNKLYNKLNKLFKNTFISNLLAHGISEVEIPKNNIFKYNLNGFYVANKVDKIIHSIPEFVDGRICNMISNKNNILTYGLQHSSLGFLQYPRFITMAKIIDEINKYYLPKKLLVENFLIKKKLNKINTVIEIIGNIRINKKLKVKNKNFTNILYIAEMHNLDELKNRIIKMKKNFKNKKLFIRLHPGKKLKQSKIVKKIEGYNKNIFIDNNLNLFDTFLKIRPFLVFTSSSTVYKELIYSNIKAVLITDFNFFTNFPIDIKFEKIIKTAEFNIKDYRKKLHRIPTKFFGKIAENRIYNIFNEK